MRSAINFQVHAIHECEGNHTSGGVTFSSLRFKCPFAHTATAAVGWGSTATRQSNCCLAVLTVALVDMHITGMFRDNAWKIRAPYLDDFDPPFSRPSEENSVRKRDT